ncbi:MAG: hypothetical protein GF398_16535 [Chitinivibrionales bacterium]|nr:hypothetical protein [Chitinivibrionales bacterium]
MVSINSATTLKFLLLVFLSAALCFSADYYVAPTGDDAADGSKSKPFRTIQHAADIMQPGDVCIIREGIYYEKVSPAASGSFGRRIIFEAWPGEKVLISAADTVTGWTKHEGHIYNAAMNWDLGKGNNQIYVNGEAMIDARWPSMQWDEYPPGGTRTFEDAKEYVEEDWFNDQQRHNHVVPVGNWRNLPTNSLLRPITRSIYHFDIKDKGWPQTDNECHIRLQKYNNLLYGKPDDHWKGAWLWGAGWWWGFSGEITHSEDSDDPVATHNGEWPTILYVNSDRMRWAGSAVFMGKLDFLNFEREWALEDNQLYLRPPDNKNPNDLTVMAKRRYLGFDLTGRNHITIKGVHFLGGSILLDSANNCIIEDCHFKYVSHYWIFKFAGGGARGAGDDAEVKAGRRGFYISGDDNLFTGCSIDHSAGAGFIIWGARNTRIHNCHITDIDYVNTYAATFHVKESQGTEVTNCTAERCGRSHVGAVDTKFLYCKFYDAMQLSGDGGLIYTFGNRNVGVEFGYCWLKGCYGEPSAYAYYDAGGYGGIWHHNVAFDFDYARGKFVPGFWYGEFYNNTFVADIKARSVSFADRWQEGNGRMRFNNLVVSNNKHRQKPYVDYKFVDSADGDFRLQAQSPAVDAGVVVPGVTDGYKGSAPDLGAYEYGGDAWVPGHTFGDPPDISSLFTGGVSAAGAPEPEFHPRAKMTQARLIGGLLHMRISRPATGMIRLFGANGALIRQQSFRMRDAIAMRMDGISSGVYLVRVMVDGVAINRNLTIVSGGAD